MYSVYLYVISISYHPMGKIAPGGAGGKFHFRDRGKRACKPGSVEDSHSSGRDVAAPL